MKTFLIFFISIVSALLPMEAVAQTDSLPAEQLLRQVRVKARSDGKMSHRTENVERIGRAQLTRAACCNLGESFVASPSVDVTYSDAATGARQIKLLGLSGTYVQMLTENVPNLRGAAIPYSLGYIPGPWMQSIQVSKGASSVKNGYESTTGQINVEFLKPQATDGVRGNAYLDSDLKFEGNADASIHLTDRLSTSLLLHYENRQRDHDGNSDGFMDMPRVRQYNLMHRWAYVSPQWISQLSLRLIKDDRHTGQSRHASMMTGAKPWRADISTNRYEMQWKNGFTLDADRNESVALMLHGSIHDAENHFPTPYDVVQTNGYAQLMYESDFGEAHNLAAGASLNYDRYKETATSLSQRNHETTPGLYAQYTYKFHSLLTAMAGLRYDHSNLWGGFVTPRLHVKYTASRRLSLRASAGKGYRTANAMAENVSLLASGRVFQFTDEGRGTDLFREEAWNYGVSASLNLTVAGKPLELNAEYYYTDFMKQMVISVDPDVWAGQPGAVPSFRFGQLHGTSYSHTVQIDATYPFFEGFSATAAFRYNDVRTTYAHVGLRQRPLTPKYKGLLTVSYKTPMEIWQFDMTGHLIGPGYYYYLPNSDRTTYHAHFQLQAQVTREFRRFSLYAGGENLTNYKMRDPIIGCHNPWGPQFDATQVWGPINGAMFYVGIRFKFE